MGIRYIAVVSLLMVCPLAAADEVVFKNGDRISGKVGEISGGKMKFTSEMLGEITIDLANVQSFKTDAPAEIRMKDGPPIQESIKEATAEAVTTETGRNLPFTDIQRINPPPEKWTGFLVGNLAIVRGNTQTLDAGVAAEAVLRRMRQTVNDRSTIRGEYNFANTGVGNDTTTTQENIRASAKYDRFFSPKWYGFGILGYEKDNIANLEYRFTPGLGAGYQWVESPNFNVSLEGGLSYVFERYDPGGNNDFLAVRLAYHIDKRLNDRVMVFHNLAWLPSVEDPFDDYLINADAGVRFDFTKSFFAQAKVEWDYDSAPSPGRTNNDYRYLVGLGLRF